MKKKEDANIKRKIVFVAHEFGLFKGHGGIASYLDILVSEILRRNSDIYVYVFTFVWDKKSNLLKDRRIKVILIEGDTLHAQGKFILKKLCRIRPDYVECADYLGFCLESIVYRSQSERNELTDTVFITLHHTASRECFEWNDKVPVRFAPPFIQECFARERAQMRMSDLNVAPSSFMNSYVSKNYNLNNVITILHPLMLRQHNKKNVIEEISQKYDLFPYEDKFIVNCISRVEGRKNQMLLVKQFERFLKETNADALLFIVGNSSINSVTNTDFRLEINEVISPEYRDKILFFDFMKEDGKEMILAISDLTVLASTYECLSLAMTESVSYEVPVICSRYCGFADYMETSQKTMTFDPFSENDLSEKITAFYRASSSERRKITDIQISGLNRLASFEETIDDRLRQYEDAKSKIHAWSGADKALVIDESNYLGLVTEEIIECGYNCVIVEFYFDKTNINTLEKWFYNIAPFFSNGDVICYSGDSFRQCTINALEERTPFFIKGVVIDENLLGKRLIDIIKPFIQSNDEIYSLLDDYEGLIDVCKKRPDDIIFKKRDAFLKELIATAFYNENGLDLKEKL